MKYLRGKSGEKGVAILITLGILCMIIVTAMTLISTATIDRKSAGNYAALQLARMVAQSGLQRTLIAMNIYSGNSVNDLNDIYSYNPSAGPADTEYLGGTSGFLSTTFNGVQYYVDYSTTPFDKAPSWLLIYADTDGASPVIARYAYKVIATSNKVDPSACMDSGYNAYTLGGSAKAITEADKPGSSKGGGSGAGSYFGQDGQEYTSITPDGHFIVGRPGRDVSEIFLRCMDDGQGWINANPAGGKIYNQKISSHWASPAGQLGSGSTWIGRWTDFDTMFSSLGVDADEEDTFRKYFTLNNSPDPEAFWYDLDNNKIKANSELYHRFNIARTDWDDTTTVNAGTIATSGLLPYPSTTGSFDGTTMPWISKWQQAGGSQSADTMRYQIAANLVDYCDIDNKATADSEDAPTYVGLERCPYINEVRLKLQGSVVVTGGADFWTRTYTCSMQISSIDVEVVDMYGSNLAATADVSVSGQYDWILGPISTPPYSTGTFSDSNRVISIPATSKSYQYGTYSSPISISPTTNNPSPSNTSRGLSTRIDNFKILSLKVKLYDASSGDFYDYSIAVDSGYNSSTYQILGNTSTSTLTAYPYTYTGTYYIDFQVADPRQNLNPQDWGAGTGAATASGTTSNGTLSNTSAASAKNTLFIPNPGGNTDAEPYATQPWELSTAYIRNGTMKSPWELGAIHRGAKWQTLNLKKFDPAKGVASALTAGGGAYASGDANILDQIKMTSDVSSYGKFDLNSSLDTGVFKALFEKIRLGNQFEYSDPGDPFNQGPGTLATDTTKGPFSTYPTADGKAVLIDSTQATSLTGAVKAASAANTGGMLYNRAELMSTVSAITSLPAARNPAIFYNNTLFPGLHWQDTDAMQEEIIGKFINLAKAEKSDNVFTVLVVAQSIKDTADSTVNSYDSGKDKITATQKVLVTVKKDISGSQNQFSIETFQYSQ